MKVHVRMTEEEFELFQKFRENVDSLRFELSHKSARLQQEHYRLCATLLQAIEMNDDGCTIVNDNLVSRAMEMALSYQQSQ